jgi:hypothetical protein
VRAVSSVHVQYLPLLQPRLTRFYSPLRRAAPLQERSPKWANQNDDSPVPTQVETRVSSESGRKTTAPNERNGPSKDPSKNDQGTKGREEQSAPVEASFLRNSPRGGGRRELSTGSRSKSTEPFLNKAGSSFEEPGARKAADSFGPATGKGGRNRAGNGTPEMRFLNVVTSDTPSPTSSPESVFGVTSANGQSKGRRGGQQGSVTETERRTEERNGERNSPQLAAGGSGGRTLTGAARGRRSSLGLESVSASKEVGFDAVSGNQTPSLAVGREGKRGTGERGPQEELGAQQPSDVESKPGRRRSLVKRFDDHSDASPLKLGPPESRTSFETLPQASSPRIGFTERDLASGEPETPRPKGRDRRARAPSALEQSLDSLAFFRHSHAGRLHIPAEPLGSPGVNWPAGLQSEGVETRQVDAAASEKRSEERRGKMDGPNVEADVHTREGKTESRQWAGLKPAAQAEVQAETERLGSDTRIASEAPGWRAPSALLDPGLSTGRQEAEWMHSQGIPSAERKERAHSGTEVDDALASLLGPAKGLDSEGATRGVLQEANALQEAPFPTSFSIPSEPRGRQLTVLILENWGDPFYVGLSGLELFDSAGKLLSVQSLEKQIRADPPDLNVLSGYGSDPRTVDKLLDGVNWTCDDLHAWLAPFTPGEVVSITVSFDDATTLGMIRVWNYNHSRIHSFRGVRSIQVRLDDRVIFMGEIRKAPGIMEGALRCAECLLFTKDENTLERLEEYDRRRYSDTANAIKVAAENAGGTDSGVESLELSGL